MTKNVEYGMLKNAKLPW